MKKNFEDVLLERSKLRWGVGIFVLLGISFLLRLTPLIEYYWLNYVTALILSNTISLSVIAILLIAIHIIELKRYKEKLEQEEDENVYG